MPELVLAAMEYCSTPEKIPSATLRRNIEREYVKGSLTATLFSPYYWAGFYHNGRKGFSVKQGGSNWLVYYKDPRRDPRYPSTGQYPQMQSQLRSTASVWEQIKADAKKGMVVFAKQVGPSSAHPFFSDTGAGGMVGLSGEFDKIAVEMSGEYFKALLESKGLFNRTVKVDV